MCTDDGYTTGMASVALVPAARLAAGARALVIGGGAGEAPTTLLESFPNMMIDVLEPDAAVIGLAREWFGFDHAVYTSDGTLLRSAATSSGGGGGGGGGGDGDGAGRAADRVRVVIDEGLRFLQRNSAGGWPGVRYDFVFVDAFVDDPHELRTPAEFGTLAFCAATAPCRSRPQPRREAARATGTATTQAPAASSAWRARL